MHSRSSEVRSYPNIRHDSTHLGCRLSAAKLGHRSIFKTSPPAGYDRNGTRTYIRSMLRDETSVRLIADQGLVERLGYKIVEEKEQLCPESSAVSGFPV